MNQIVIVRTSVTHPKCRAVMKELDGQPVRTVFTLPNPLPERTYRVVFTDDE